MVIVITVCTVLQYIPIALALAWLHAIPFVLERLTFEVISGHDRSPAVFFLFVNNF